MSESELMARIRASVEAATVRDDSGRAPPRMRPGGAMTEYKRAKDLAKITFPVSAETILQMARKNGIGRKFGRDVIFSPADIERLYEVCPSSSSVAQNQRTGSSAAPSAESELKKAQELLTKKRRKKFAPRESEILAESVYGGRATAGTPGDVALCRESRSCRTSTPGRLEISSHGHAIHPTSANWRIRSIGFLRKVGKSGGRANWRGKNRMTINMLMRANYYLGKAEVDSSILSGSTRKISKNQRHLVIFGANEARSKNPE